MNEEGCVECIGNGEYMGFLKKYSSCLVLINFFYIGIQVFFVRICDCLREFNYLVVFVKFFDLKVQ